MDEAITNPGPVVGQGLRASAALEQSSARWGFSASSLKAFLVLGDLAVAWAAVAIHTPLWGERFPSLFFLWIATAATLITGVYVVEGYEIRAYRQSEGMFTRLLLGVGISAVGMTVLAVAAPQLGLYRRPVVLLYVNLLPILLAWRLGAARWLRASLNRRLVALIGEGDKLTDLQAAFGDSDVYSVAMVIDSEVAHEFASSGDPVAETSSRLASILRERQIDLVAVADLGPAHSALLHDLVECRYREVEVQDAASCIELLQKRVPIRYLDDEWVAFSSRFMGWDRDFEEKLKRLIDVSIAGAGLILALPVMLSVGLVVALTSRGPVVFRQERVGRAGSTFTILKFRSMLHDAESEGAVWAQEDDPRTTFIGSILRRTHLDELPQLWNVVRGNMSLVGPRPERPEFVDQLRAVIPFYDLRHVVKPGLTGWAQVRHPYGASVEDAEAKLEYDLYYLRHKNLFWDLSILLRTVTVAFLGRGSR